MDMGEESDWAWLPKHLLDMILYNLASLSDWVRFGAVCKPWHSVAIENKLQILQNKRCRQVPFLMLPTEDNSEERCSLYSITLNKFYDFQLQIPYKKRFCGSSHGWLFTVEETLGLTMMNPFSGAIIELPPIMDLSEIQRHESEDDIEVDFEYEYDTTPIDVESEVVKAILSADPTSSPNDYIVTAIYSDCCRLAFIRAGDEAWTYIDKEKFVIIYDVIYYKGQIFAVDNMGGVLMIDVNRRVGESKAPQVEVIAPGFSVYSHPMYLVESSSGDLLLVQRFIEYGDEDEDGQPSTSGFKVFKLLLDQFEQGWPKRVEVKSLGGDTLFLGDNHSICVSASKWPGCQLNSIYYTDDYIEVFYCPTGHRDIGTFNLENGSFGRHYISHPLHNNNMPPSIWIVPTMLGN